MLCIAEGIRMDYRGGEVGVVGGRLGLWVVDGRVAKAGGGKPCTDASVHVHIWLERSASKDSRYASAAVAPRKHHASNPVTRSRSPQILLARSRTLTARRLRRIYYASAANRLRRKTYNETGDRVLQRRGLLGLKWHCVI